MTACAAGYRWRLPLMRYVDELVRGRDAVTAGGRRWRRRALSVAVVSAALAWSIGGQGAFFCLERFRVQRTPRLPIEDLRASADIHSTRGRGNGEREREFAAAAFEAAEAAVPTRGLFPIGL